jgi:hypothetical protein
LTLAKTAEGAQLEHVLANLNLIIPKLWQTLLKPERWMVGRAYSDVHSEGRKVAASGLSKALMKVHGFDYVPEDLRSRTFLQAANELQNIHFALNNYYNEPSAIGHLASLGTVIPPPVLGQCITAILCVRLGNHWGRSLAAQERASQMLLGIGMDRWKYYLDECLPADNIILEKLSDEVIAMRWGQVVNDLKLDGIEIKNADIAQLVKKSSQGKNQDVSKLAKNLNLRLNNN